MTTTLITGVTGFVGGYLLDQLTDGERSLYGTVRETSTLDRTNENRGSIDLITCDLVDASAVFDLVEEVQPDHIYHLAGQSSVKSSWESTHSLVNNNIVATLNVLEAVRRSDSVECRILLACSSEEYGLVSDDDIPIDETTPLNPLSPYAVTKATVDMFGFQYYKSHGVKTIRTRAFNHTGPRRPDTYALGDFARQIVEIEGDLTESDAIRVGNLDAIRDYTDVRDVVRAYEIAMDECQPGEAYNICSSEGYSMSDLLSRLLDLSGDDIPFVQEESRMRPADVPKLVGDSSKFRDATGWEPDYDINETLADLLGYWRAELDVNGVSS